MEKRWIDHGVSVFCFWDEWKAQNQRVSQQYTGPLGIPHMVSCQTTAEIKPVIALQTARPGHRDPFHSHSPLVAQRLVWLLHGIASWSCKTNRMESSAGSSRSIF